MTIEELKTIIKEGENTKVDFKSEWYKYTEAKKPKINNEFVRDMFALANGDIHSVDKTSYLIIGVMDNNDKREDDKVISIEDIENKIYDFDKSKMLFLDKFTQQLLDTLNNYAQPEFLALDIEWYEIGEDTNILVLAIPPHGRLISLSQDLNLGNTTDKKGTVYYRIGENVRVASADVIEDFRKAFAKNENKSGVVINQTHSGSGDNIARDKIIYQKSE